MPEDTNTLFDWHQKTAYQSPPLQQLLNCSGRLKLMFHLRLFMSCQVAENICIKKPQARKQNQKKSHVSALPHFIAMCFVTSGWTVVTFFFYDQSQTFNHTTTVPQSTSPHSGSMWALNLKEIAGRWRDLAHTSSIAETWKIEETAGITAVKIEQSGEGVCVRGWR